MEPGDGDSLVIEEGKSGELSAALRTIADVTTHDGEPKYSERCCRTLARTIACRTYAPALLELCHLVAAASAADRRGGRYEPLFWGPSARPGAFRAFFSAAGVPGLAATEAGITLDLDGGTFSVAYSRMPFLAALLEFLVTALGYTAVDEGLAPLTPPLPDAAVVGEAANDLARRLYDWLKDHLPTVQGHRKSRAMLAFLKERGGDASLEAVDDGAILDFWLQVSADPPPGTDFRAYATVFRLGLALAVILRHARDRREIDSPRPIGTDWEAGEVDPADIEQAVAVADEAIGPLQALAEPPAAAVTFLNGREAGVAASVLEAGRDGPRLTLSVLRHAVFGKAQSRITNITRKDPAAEDLAAFIERAAEDDYAGQVTAYRGLLAHLERVRLRRAEAIELVLALAPDADLGALRDRIAGDAERQTDSEGTVVTLGGASPAGRFLDALAVPDSLPDADLVELMQRARAAFGGIARRGFRDEDLADEDVAAGYAAAIAPLGRIQAAMAAVLARLDGAGADADGWFAADRSLFTRQFRTLYGVDHGR